jgi:pimeloyl-ACP methyl ester carboxylesterase
MGHYTTTDGCSIAYEVAGDGEPLVLLHGWSQSQQMFKYQIADLRTRRKVITFDFRGHGRSGKPEGGYRIARLAQDLRELVDHLEIERADMLGWSMGVSVLWSYIDLHGTGRVRKLICVDQPAVVSTLPGMTEQQAADCGAIFDLAGLGDFATSLLGPEAEAIRLGFLRTMASPDIDDEAVAWLLRESLRMRADWGAQLLIDHCCQDWRDVLGRIDVETLVIGGEVSHVSPRSQAWIAEAIPQGRLQVFTAEQRGSHYVFFENPNAFNHVIDEFLATTAVGAGGASATG